MIKRYIVSNLFPAVPASRAQPTIPVRWREIEVAEGVVPMAPPSSGHRPLTTT